MIHIVESVIRDVSYQIGGKHTNLLFLLVNKGHYTASALYKAKMFIWSHQ